MPNLHVAVGEAAFYHETAKLHCQAVVRAMLSVDQVGFDEKVCVDASTLNSLDLCHRLAQPLMFAFDFAFVDSVRWELEAAMGSMETLARQLSSVQFWQQLNLAVVSIDLPTKKKTRYPLHVQLQLGLEGTGSVNASSSHQSQASKLNVNDLNYPASLDKARIDRVSIELQLTPQKTRKSIASEAAESCLTRAVHHDVVHVHDQDLLAIVDAVLRCSISPARQRLMPGVKRKGMLFQNTLQGLFPAAFSPTGFRYLTERKNFTSGISRNILSCLSRAEHARQGSQLLAQSSQLQRYNQQLQPETDQIATFDDIEALLWGCLTRTTRDSQRKVALNPMMKWEHLSRTNAAVLSEPFGPLTNSKATLSFDQSLGFFGTDASELQSNYSHNSNSSKAEVADWSQEEDLLDKACDSCAMVKDQSSTLHEDLFQANGLDERDGTTALCGQGNGAEELRHSRGSQDGLALPEFPGELLEENSPSITGQQHCRSRSSAELMLTDAPPNWLGARKETPCCMWEDLIGGAPQLTQRDIDTRSPNQASTNWQFAQDPPKHFTANENVESDILTMPQSYLLYKDPHIDTGLLPHLERYSISPQPQLNLSQISRVLRTCETEASTSSDNDLFLIAPKSTQTSMPSFQDLHRQTIVNIPAEEPTLEELLGDDKGLWDMWQRRGSLGLQSGSIRSMYESDPDMKVIGGHWKRSSSAESVEDQIGRPSSTYARAPANQSPLRNSSLIKRSSTSSSTSSSTTEKKPSRLRRLSKSSKASSKQEKLDFDFSRILADRDVEVKRRKTLEDYDDEHEMLFR